MQTSENANLKLPFLPEFNTHAYVDCAGTAVTVWSDSIFPHSSFFWYTNQTQSGVASLLHAVTKARSE